MHSNLGVTYRGVTYRPTYVDEVLHPHAVQMYQTVGNNLLFQQANASIAAIWQGTVCKLVMSSPLTGLPGPDTSLIGHPWDILGQRVHERIPSQLPHFPYLNTSWLKNGNAFHEGWGYNPRLLLSMSTSLIECFNKDGGHTRYNLQYIHL